jgi:hypothetical protein
LRFQVIGDEAQDETTLHFISFSTEEQTEQDVQSFKLLQCFNDDFIIGGDLVGGGGGFGENIERFVDLLLYDFI